MENHPELGFGIMRMPQKDGRVNWKKSKQLIDEYMKGRFCYFDTHPFYVSGQSQRIIKEYVVKEYDRERFLLANKMPYGKQSCFQDYYQIFQDELRDCGVEYFDYYLLHAISEDIYEMHKKIGGFRFLKEIKEKGKAKKIGFSFHDDHELLDEILNKHPEIDFVQLQINYLDWENPLIQSKACYEVARKYKKPILVMEPIKGGKLALEENPGEYARRALQFVKALPGIQVILSGMNEIKQIVENRQVLAEMDDYYAESYSVYQDLRKRVEKENTIPCTECGYCVRECQKGIRIPEILSMVNTYGRMYERIRVLYKNTLFGKGGAEECVNCGMCERYCPQKIEIRKHLKKVINLIHKEYFYTSERNVQILISLLHAYGIKKIIASPGATNASFVYSVQQDDFFEMYSAPDERSAAYMACGLARESGEPVALSCTGATASRNYLPGLTEAFYRNIPILAITSALPSGRIGHNLPQVVDRTKIQNDIVKLSVEMPYIKDDEDEWNCVVNANRALNELWHGGMGPVHINLVTMWNQDFSVKELPHTRIIRRVQRGEKCPDIPAGKIAVFCGEHDRWSDKEISIVDSFCKIYGAVVICDHTSNYSGGYRWTPSFLEGTIRERSICDIDVLIHIGNISGAYFPIHAKEVWRVHPDGKYRDTFRTLSYVFELDEQSFFETYVKKDHIKEVAGGIERWPIIKKKFRQEPLDMPFSNAWVASQTAHRIPKNSVLHLAILNSLRIWNYYEIPESVRVYANTGGFGIDGCLSTLIGASLANPEKLYFGILGDLAFFYDMNVLGNRHVGDNIRLLIVNNGCGTEFKNYNHSAKIFEDQTDLYIAAKGHYGDKSKSLLKGYAESLGFLYKSASTKEEYLKVLPQFISNGKTGKSTVIEIFTNSENESMALELLDERKEEKIELEKEVLPQWIKDLPEKEVVLWGCGNNFFKNIAKVEQYCKIRYVCDNNPEKWNTEVLPGIQCISPEQLKNKDDIFVVIMIEDGTEGFDIVHQLQMLDIQYFDIVKKWLGYAGKLKWRQVNE